MRQDIRTKPQNDLPAIVTRYDAADFFQPVLPSMPRFACCADATIVTGKAG